MNLQRLQQLCAEGHLDLYYADESTFSMNPCLPYGWQAKGETIGIVPHTNRKINVFSIFNANSFGFTKFSDCNINAEFIVSAIEDFTQNVTPNKPTVLVLDNAAMHHSLLFRSKSPIWQEKGLFIFYLPKYSPHLNIAEIFANIGSKYQINFKEQKCQSISA